MYKEVVKSFVEELGYDTYADCMRVHAGKTLDSFVVCNRECDKEQAKGHKALLPEDKAIFYFEGAKVHIWFYEERKLEDRIVNLNDPDSFERIKETILNCINLRSNNPAAVHDAHIGLSVMLDKISLRTIVRMAE